MNRENMVFGSKLCIGKYCGPYLPLRSDRKLLLL